MKRFLATLSSAALLAGLLVLSPPLTQVAGACGWYWTSTPGATVSGPYFDYAQQRNTYVDNWLWIESNSCSGNRQKIIYNRLRVEDGSVVRLNFAVSAYLNGQQITPCYPDACVGWTNGSDSYYITPVIDTYFNPLSGNDYCTRTTGNVNSSCFNKWVS